MDTGPFAPLLLTLWSELADGSSDSSGRTYVLNQGDGGLLAALERLPAAAASAAHDGSSIAAHVDHLRYGLSLLNRWASGAPPPWPDMDWTASWRKNVVSDSEWRKLLDELRREAHAWAVALRTPREASHREAGRLGPGGARGARRARWRSARLGGRPPPPARGERRRGRVARGQRRALRLPHGCHPADRPHDTRPHRRGQIGRASC